jgi:hypothetical protein
MAHLPIMHFTETAVRLASVALHTKQLDIGSIAAAATGKRHYMIIFQIV